MSTIKNSDNFLVNRGDDSYHVLFNDIVDGVRFENGGIVKFSANYVASNQVDSSSKFSSDQEEGDIYGDITVFNFHSTLDLTEVEGGMVLALYNELKDSRQIYNVESVSDSDITVSLDGDQSDAVNNTLDYNDLCTFTIGNYTAGGGAGGSSAIIETPFVLTPAPTEISDAALVSSPMIGFRTDDPIGDPQELDTWLEGGYNLPGDSYNHVFQNENPGGGGAYNVKDAILCSHQGFIYYAAPEEGMAYGNVLDTSWKLYYAPPGAQGWSSCDFPIKKVKSGWFIASTGSTLVCIQAPAKYAPVDINADIRAEEYTYDATMITDPNLTYPEAYPPYDQNTLDADGNPLKGNGFYIWYKFDPKDPNEQWKMGRPDPASEWEDWAEKRVIHRDSSGNQSNVKQWCGKIWSNNEDLAICCINQQSFYTKNGGATWFRTMNSYGTYSSPSYVERFDGQTLNLSILKQPSGFLYTWGNTRYRTGNTGKPYFTIWNVGTKRPDREPLRKPGTESVDDVTMGGVQGWYSDPPSFHGTTFQSTIDPRFVLQTVNTGDRNTKYYKVLKYSVDYGITMTDIKPGTSGINGRQQLANVWWEKDYVYVTTQNKGTDPQSIIFRAPIDTSTPDIGAFEAAPNYVNRKPQMVISPLGSFRYMITGSKGTITGDSLLVEKVCISTGELNWVIVEDGTNLESWRMGDNVYECDAAGVKDIPFKTTMLYYYKNMPDGSVELNVRDNGVGLFTIGKHLVGNPNLGSPVHPDFATFTSSAYTLQQGDPGYDSYKLRRWMISPVGGAAAICEDVTPTGTGMGVNSKFWSEPYTLVGSQPYTVAVQYESNSGGLSQYSPSVKFETSVTTRIGDDLFLYDLVNNELITREEVRNKYGVHEVGAKKLGLATELTFQPSGDVHAFVPVGDKYTPIPDMTSQVAELQSIVEQQSRIIQSVISDWDSSKPYEVDDIVEYNNKYFAARVANTGTDPTNSTTWRFASINANATNVNFEVKVQDGRYTIDGEVIDKLHIRSGVTYVFDTSDSTNSGHPFNIYSDSGRTTQADAVDTSVAGRVTYAPTSAGTVYFACEVHSGMGGELVVS